jgi:hypothetical protein
MTLMMEMTTFCSLPLKLVNRPVQVDISLKRIASAKNAQIASTETGSMELQQPAP